MTVAISGINTTDNPGPGYGVSRSLKEASRSTKILGLSYDLKDPGHFMKFAFDITQLLPFPTLGEEGIINELLRLKKQEGVNFAIPCLDAELPIYIQNQELLKEAGIGTFLPSPSQFQLRDKAELAQLADSLGIQYPQTAIINSLDDLEKEQCLEIGYPAFVKGRYYQAYKSVNQMDAIKNFTKITKEWGLPILFQKPVFGEEVNVVGVGDGEGGELGMVMIKKLSMTSLGKVWSAVTIKNYELYEITKKFLEVTKWKGPFELECLLNSEGITLIEVNPRFPAWTYFATAVGINLPERMINFATKNERVKEEVLNYDAGKLFMRYTEEIITDLSELAV